MLLLNINIFRNWNYEKNYIKWIRSKVGHEKIFLNFVGGCIKNDKGDILLQRRSDKNKWGFPGGAMEIGESAKEATLREIKEETGLDVEIENLIGIYTDYYDEYPNGDYAQTISIFFELKVIGGCIDDTDSETLELKYFNINDFPKLVNKQHNDVYHDIKNKVYGVIR